jgi:hypothetical protein
MVELVYSPAALDVLKEFYRVKWVVYVEGPDDIAFWRVVLDLGGLTNYELKYAGGRDALDRYQEALLEDSADIVIARDTDFDDLLSLTIDHPRILFTWGYSIENSLFEASRLAKALTGLMRTMEDIEPEVKEWMSEMEATFRPLASADLANRIADGGIDLQLENSARFMDDRLRHRPSASKVAAHLKRHLGKLSAGAKTAAEAALTTSTKPIRAHITATLNLFFISTPITCEMDPVCFS